MQLTYHIDLDERGDFFADVRDIDDRTIYEIHGWSIFEDGFMCHKNDTENLLKYLKQLGIASNQDTLI